LNKQYNILGDLGFLLKEGKSYIPDFTSKDSFYNELYEDLLYLSLNIILANDILKSVKLNNVNEEEFFVLLGDITQKHYNEYKESYNCLNLLRISGSNSFLSKYQLD
jgi:hypothetical protein